MSHGAKEMTKITVIILAKAIIYMYSSITLMHVL